MAEEDQGNQVSDMQKLKTQMDAAQYWIVQFEGIIAGLNQNDPLIRTFRDLKGLKSKIGQFLKSTDDRFSDLTKEPAKRDAEKNKAVKEWQDLAKELDEEIKVLTKILKVEDEVGGFIKEFDSQKDHFSDLLTNWTTIAGSKNLNELKQHSRAFYDTLHKLYLLLKEFDKETQKAENAVFWAIRYVQRILRKEIRVFEKLKNRQVEPIKTLIENLERGISQESAEAQQLRTEATQERNMGNAVRADIHDAEKEITELTNLMETILADYKDKENDFINKTLDKTETELQTNLANLLKSLRKLYGEEESYANILMKSYGGGRDMLSTLTNLRVALTELRAKVK
ncbi:hypothetical protein JXC34_01680 [Candidatus Woesearchaeota archaeon]|nr:hypothetical protein [Candidatus Woesearchaeota archaeon]